jgi:hypothetical protein
MFILFDDLVFKVFDDLVFTLFEDLVFTLFDDVFFKVFDDLVFKVFDDFLLLGDILRDFLRDFFDSKVCKVLSRPPLIMLALTLDRREVINMIVLVKDAAL